MWRETGECWLRYQNGTPIEEWLADMKQYGRLFTGANRFTNKVRFIVGDALVAGELQYGEAYTQGFFDGLDDKTIDNLMRVCQNIPPENRHLDGLNWTHHDAVHGVKNPELQSKLLREALANRETASDLRNIARRATLTEPERKLIAQQTDRDPEELKAPEINRLIKRAKSGKPPKRELVIDLDNEESLRLAAEHVLAFFIKNEDDIEEWSAGRKESWKAAFELAEMLGKKPEEATK